MVAWSAAVVMLVVPVCAATDMVFVVDGQATASETLGPGWTASDGYLEAVGRNTVSERLLGRCSLGEGDFTVELRLAILNLDRSAAAVTFGDNNYFGFAGSHGKVFLTGPFFDNARGKPIAEPAEWFAEGHPFDLQIRRVGEQFTIQVDGRTIYEQTVTTAALGAVGLTPVRSTMRLYRFTASGNLQPYVAPKLPQPVRDNVVLDPRATALPGWPHGPFVRLADGGILALSGKNAMVSHDDGASWQARPVFGADEPFAIRDERAMLRTRDGTIVAIFLNNAVLKYSWDKAANAPLPDMHLPTYCLRSRDDGQTWDPPILLYDGWCGCVQDIVQHSGGRLIVPGQELLFDEARHATMPYWSADDGVSWQRTRYLDIGGRGDHAGAIEGTLVELRDGRLWLLLRSYDGFFYESFSDDAGETWTDQRPSSILSTGSPGQLTRLASGRLALVWNPPPAAGYRVREQLSIAFSGDDGQTWSAPQVIATNQGGRVSYAQVFERTPGELVITTMQGGLRCVIREEDCLVKPRRIVAFGSSTTAPRGSLRVYADILRDELPARGLPVEVFNAGIGGDTTELGRARFEQDVLDRRPDLVIIQLGINDAAVDVWRNPPAPGPRVALERYRENLTYFVTTLQAQGAQVILMTPNPLRWADKTRKLYGQPPYDPQSPDGFSVTMPPYVEAVRQVAAERGVKLIDVWAAYHDYDGIEGQSMDGLLLDGMHPNEAGHRLVAERLIAAIRPAD